MVGCEGFLFPNTYFPPKAIVAFRVTWLHCTMITSKYFGICEHSGFFKCTITADEIQYRVISFTCTIIISVCC